VCLKTPPAIFCINSAEQNAAASPSPGRFRPRPAMSRLIVVCLRSETGRARRIWPASHLLVMTNHPPKRQIFVEFTRPQNGAAFPSPCRFRPSPATQRLIVVRLNFLTRWIDQIWPARRVWLCLTPPSIARPNLTKPNHPSVNCGLRGSAHEGLVKFCPAALSEGMSRMMRRTGIIV
jgi:hypothetical protein